jgi:hypothetical protein
MGTRLAALVVALLALMLVAGCGSASTAAVTAASVTAAPNTATPTVPSPTSSHAAPPARTAAPAPTTSINQSNPGPFGGSWKGNNATLDVSGDESANASYFVGVLCSSATPALSPCDDDSVSPTIPGGQLKLHITMVATTGGVAVASAEVKDSSDPKYPEGSIMKFTLKNGTISSPIGTFTKVPSSD